MRFHTRVALPLLQLVAVQAAQQYYPITGIHDNGCLPTRYYQAQDRGTVQPEQLEAQCSAVCTNDSRCAAFVYQYQTAPNGLSTGQCYYYPDSSVPSAPATCANKPSGIAGFIKDKSLQCLSSSTKAASAFCSSYLHLGTVTRYTATVFPTTTLKFTTQLTLPTTSTQVLSTTSTQTPETSTITDISISSPATSIITTLTVTTPSLVVSTITSTFTPSTTTHTDITISTPPASVETFTTSTLSTVYTAAVVKRAAKAPTPACIPSTEPTSLLSSACSQFGVSRSTVYRVSTAHLATQFTVFTTTTYTLALTSSISVTVSTASAPLLTVETTSTLATPLSTVTSTSTAATPRSATTTTATAATPGMSITQTTTLSTRITSTTFTSTLLTTLSGCAANCLRSVPMTQYSSDCPPVPTTYVTKTVSPGTTSTTTTIDVTTTRTSYIKTVVITNPTVTTTTTTSSTSTIVQSTLSGPEGVSTLNKRSYTTDLSPVDMLRQRAVSVSVISNNQPQAPSQTVPTYASLCTNYNAYTSACSCLLTSTVTSTSTITLATPVSTISKTQTVTSLILETTTTTTSPTATSAVVKSADEYLLCKVHGSQKISARNTANISLQKCLQFCRDGTFVANCQAVFYDPSPPSRAGASSECYWYTGGVNSFLQYAQGSNDDDGFGYDVDCPVSTY